MNGALTSLYGFRYATILVYMFQSAGYNAGSYLGKYWRTQNFQHVIEGQKLTPSKNSKLLLTSLRVGMSVQVLVGLYLIWSWLFRDYAGGWQFGLALIISYPIVWAHLLPVMSLLSRLQPKKIGREIVCLVLERQVVRLRAKHSFKVVAVVGAIGKTSTKIAIAKTLQSSQRVIWQEGNYNDRVTVPLILFGREIPNLLNVFAWIKIWAHNRRTINGEYPYDVAVVELGTDRPGEISKFAYLKPDIVVLTAVTPEHMEYFGTIRAVAAEELSALGFAGQSLVNVDNVPATYLKGKKYLSYGLHASANYHAIKRKTLGLDGQSAKFVLNKKDKFELDIPMLGDQGAKIAIAAAATTNLLGVSAKDLKKGLKDIAPFAGRMQVLPGLHGSTIIDDTYNSSPVAATAALNVLYKIKAPQRIAILGSMNELGNYSEKAHREVGKHCNPKKLDYVVTIGTEADKWLAPAAEVRGCKVEKFSDPYTAGEFVVRKLKDNAVVLAKGSQNGVFAEESVKTLLANPKDESKLVRQSKYWLKVKRKQFKT